MSDTHKILLISTGGTIAGKVATEKKKDQDIKDLTKADSFDDLVRSTLTIAKKKWDIEVVIEHEPICDVDSSDILPKQWSDLAGVIKNKYDEYNSFIITHGTNTMGYTCAALSFALLNLNKPVIVTGSQVPAGMPGTDADTNLNNAIRVVVWPRERYNYKKIKGVLAVFGSHIITGTRVKKETEFDYDAFVSFGSGSIGRIGRIININESNLENHLRYLRSSSYPEAISAKDLRCENEFFTNIASLTEFPGMSPKIFISLVENNGIGGFILRAFGAGDASMHIRPAFEYLKSKEIPIVVTTQAPNGNSNFQVNEPGQYLKENKLAIPAYDMSIESQTAKLAWLLAKKNKGELSYSKLCEEMVRDMHGEVGVMWEMEQ